jgi:hypothetical protein
MPDDEVDAESEFALQELEDAQRIKVDPNNLDAYLAYVVDGLRRSGNEPLASQYEASFRRFLAVDAQASQPGVLPNEQLRIAMYDALEDFERIEAEVKAWFESKGGAR